MLRADAMIVLLVLTVASVACPDDTATDDSPKKTLDERLRGRAEELLAVTKTYPKTLEDWRECLDAQRHLPPVPLDDDGRPVGLSATITLLHPDRLIVPRQDDYFRYCWKFDVHEEPTVAGRFAVRVVSLSEHWPTAAAREANARPSSGRVASVPDIRHDAGDCPVLVNDGRKGAFSLGEAGHYELLVVVAAYPLDGGLPILLDAADAIVTMKPN